MNTRALLVVIFISFWHSGYCKPIVVCQECPTSNIVEAYQKAAPGDTLLVKAGKYDCSNLLVNKRITFLAEEGAILDGGGQGYVLRLLEDSITISGFQIINSGRSYTKDFAAIYISGSTGFKIIDNQIENSFFGILVEKSKEGLIRGNKVIGSAKQEDQAGNGVHLWHCDDMEIRGNEVFGMRDGIYLEFVDQSNVIANYTHNNVRYGLHFMFSNYDSYLDNTFQNNGAGVAVMFSKWIKMEGNKFAENWGTAAYGLLLKEIYDCEVVNNTFDKNTLGIFVDGSSRVNYFNNTFSQNGWAIKVTGGCYANNFKANNFLNNSFDISYNARMNDNSFDGNYWSSYNGYDLDRDGTGDVPYRPVKLFSYIINRTPETIILLRSLFVDIINFSEKVSPAFTPDDLVDTSPSMKSFQ